MAILAGLSPIGFATTANAQDGEIEAEKAADNTTVIYGAEFIARFPDATSVLDIVIRVPGAEAILGQRGGGGGGGGWGRDKRGFSSNDDRVLINGKRMSGKDIRSRNVLERINPNRLLRLEIIRGSSPDIKVSSQEAVLNVVLKDGGDVSTGSGSWSVDARYLTDGRFRVGASVSYSNRLGPVDFLVAAKQWPRHMTHKQVDERFDANGVPTERVVEKSIKERFSREISTNLTFNLNNGEQVRLNGMFSKDPDSEEWPGELYLPDATGALVLSGDAIRIGKESQPEFEVGGDWETQLGDNLTFKILGLYSNKTSDSENSEDSLIAAAEPEYDYIFLQDKLSTEAIGRSSVVWDMGSGTTLEIGTEMAKNKVDTDLEYFEREGGVLVLQDLDAAQLVISEFRNESFAIYSMKLNDKMSFDASTFFEYSKIKQLGEGIDESKSFTFFKPSIDYRYNITKSDQAQLSVRRTVSQLNFSDFAASVSRDDEVVSGNTNLVPEKTWTFEASYEHRFADDQGRVKARILHEQYEDKITRIEVSPGAGGNGNAGNARYTRYILEGNFRLGFIGVPDFVINGSVELRDSNIESPFTGEDVKLNYRDVYQANINFRHDINDWGLSYGGSFRVEGKTIFNDYSYNTFINQDRIRFDLWAEKKVFGSMIARLHVEEILNGNKGRTRDYYDAGVVSGVLTGSEIRDTRHGVRFLMSLRSTF
jgi:hypothetical protein